MDDELGDAIARLDLEDVVWVEIDQRDFEFSPIMTVNETRGIEHGYALLDGKAATRLNEAGVSFRNGNGDSSRNQGSFERLNLEALDRAKIHAGIAGVRVRRNFNPVNKGGQRYGQGIGHVLLLRCVINACVFA